MNILDNVSSIVEQLPQNFVNDMIINLNEIFDRREKYRKQLETPGISDTQYNVIQKRYITANMELSSIICFLNNVGLHPVRLPFRPNTYTFPTYNDCEAWEDYLYEKSDF